MPQIIYAGALHSFYFYLNTTSYTGSGNPNSQDSFYTSNPDGENIGGYNLIASNWFYLFMGYTPGWGGVPYGEALSEIGRYFNPTLGDHLFKRGAGSQFAPSGYYYEGAPIVVGYVHNGPHRIPVYRWWNPTTWDHRYKTNPSAPQGNWHYEGIAWYSPVMVYGCRDSNANNWNMYANQPSTGCTYTVYGCTDPIANNYNSSATQDNGTCTYTAAAASIAVTPPAILVGGTSSLAWYTNYATLASISGIGSVSVNQSGSQNVSPPYTTSYTLTATNYGNVQTTASTTLTVYQPPVITLSTDAVNNTIVAGQSCNLTWNTSGDNSGGANLSPILGNVPASSSTQISPTATTTYTISVNGYLGTNDSDQITITVLNQPEANVSSDPFVSYGENINVEYSTVNAVQVSMIVTYFYLDGTQNVTNEVVTNHSDSLVITPSYNTFGPSHATITIDVEGYNSLTATAQSTTAIIIDQTPDAIVVPASEDKIKDEDPVITPESTVTTTIEVTDIDIPVEIKSDHPIQVDVDDQGWLDLKEI